MVNYKEYENDWNFNHGLKNFLKYLFRYSYGTTIIVNNMYLLALEDGFTLYGYVIVWVDSFPDFLHNVMAGGDVR